MKLLFDQNLSPSLPRVLADIYAGSIHIREIGMRDATDTEIWEYAKSNDFVIVSKDPDSKPVVYCTEVRLNSSGYASATVPLNPSKNYSAKIQRPFIHSD